ncbi:MAG: hypothetical protein VR67_00310 [Peptococcaceae bacterium BRH_c8a]|nr:MAG: hypothetical protein VR67_00310 [Peptococcaceae bacterium BRH_c8a]
MVNRPKVVDLEKKRKTRTGGTVWDGERLKLAGDGRDKGQEQELAMSKKTANKKKLLVAVAVIIAAAMLGSAFLNFFSGIGR